MSHMENLGPYVAPILNHRISDIYPGTNYERIPTRWASLDAMPQSLTIEFRGPSRHQLERTVR